jgi:hypothetical protein
MNVTIENFVGVFEDAYSKEYCNSVIQYFESMKEAGMTSSRQQNENISKTLKNDLQLFGHDEVSITYTKSFLPTFNNVFWGEVYPAYAGTFDVLKNTDPHNNYAFKIQKTCVGEGYHVWHSENGNRATCTRILAWTLYLNDVDEGGETEFLYYPKRIKPKAGTLILWPAGFTHTHRGNPPISNTKYIVTGWIEF